MSEPKNPEPTGGLPLDWSLSNVTETTPAPSAPMPQSVPPVVAQPLAEAQVSPPKSIPVAAAEPARPSSPAMDLNVLGAIGSWQASRTPAPMPPPRPAAPVQTVAPIPPPPAPKPAPVPAAPAQPVAEAPTPPPAPAALPTPAPAPARLPAVAKPAVLVEAEVSDVAPVGLLHRVNFWRATTALALALAIVFALMPGTKPVAFEVAVAPIGVVNAPAPIYLAELGEGKLRVTPLAIVAVPAAKDLQLWMFMLDSQTPISLGVLPATGGIFTLPQIPAEGARFVVSLEPHGGSTGGKITGDVLYGGTLAKR